MAITRSPKDKASEAQIEALIKKGGQPARQETVSRGPPAYGRLPSHTGTAGRAPGHLPAG